MKFHSTIDRGGFGRVERVILKDGSHAARKVFDPDHIAVDKSEREKLRARFVREVRVQSALPHEYFLPVLSSDLTGEHPWFTMPVADKNYAKQIAEDRRERRPISRQPLADILNALEELHNLGYVHRDLKPQNVLLHEGVWKLTDFGLVLPPADRTTKLTSPDSTWGTPQYCAPEQSQDFRSSTTLADIYAFGCILHDVFAGRPRIPYAQQSCGEPVGWVIEKCTEISASKRFKNIASLRGALFSVLSDAQAAKGSQEDQEWVLSLQSVNSWTPERFEKFVRFLRASEGSRETVPVYYAMDEDKLRSLQGVDRDMWSTLAEEYCEWAQGSFDFEYCDVLIRRLELIFELGSLACKAAAVITAARMGASHNRWFVMRRLLAMCGGSLNEQLATRIAIEIQAVEAEDDFRTCARKANRDISAYHPKIVAVLT